VQYLLLTAEKVKEQYAYQQAADFCHRALALTAKAEGLGHEQERGLVLLGDLWSLMDDIVQANKYYERALALATDLPARQHIAHKRHRPHTVLRHGAKIAFYEHGGGDHTLVFVHPARVYNLASFQPVLEQLCQEFRIINIDPRGRGASDPLPGPYRFTDHAEDVRAVIEASRAGPVVGVGASRGGTLMLTLAAAYPALLHTLVLVSSHAAPSVTYAQHQAASWFIEFTELLRQGQTEPALRIWASLIHSEPGTSHLAEQFVRATLSTISPEMLLSYVTPDPEDDVVQLLPHIRVPTLVMHGTGDRLVPFAMGRYLAEHISGAQF
jgi:pimeloyl-ACP methyl ester carboxylesterase